MKIIFSLCLLLLTEATLLAQELVGMNPLNSPHNSRFTLGLFFNESVNTYHVHGKTIYGTDAIVKSHTGYNYGVTCGYQIGKRSNIQLGAGYSDFGYDLEWRGTYYPQGLYRYNVAYVEVPLEFRMMLPPARKKLKVFCSAGVFAAFLTKNSRGNPTYVSGTTQLDLSKLDNFSTYSSILGGLDIGGGLTYSLSSKVAFEVQPITIKVFFNRNAYYAISPESNYSSISSVGFKFSVNCKI